MYARTEALSGEMSGAPIGAARTVLGAEYAPTEVSQVSPDRDAANEKVDQSPGLAKLVLVFLWLGVVPVGGKTVGFLFDELVRRRRWLAAEEFVEGQTLAKLLPGPSGANMLIFAVQQLRGPLAAVLCLAPFVLPGAVAMLALSLFMFGVERPQWVTGAVQGLSAAAVALLLTSSLRMAADGLKTRIGAVFVALAFAANGILGLDLLLVLASLGLLSLAVHRPRERASC